MYPNVVIFHPNPIVDAPIGRDQSWEDHTMCEYYYRKVSNIRRTLVGNKIVDHSDVVGASAVGAAPTTSSFST